MPLNMAEPVLFIKGERNATNRGFAPHGPGRNMNRTMHKKLMADRTNEEIFNTETQGLDARFYSGNIGISELPSAYKNTESVVSDMHEYSLVDVMDRVMPYGSIMACDWQRGVSWIVDPATALSTFGYRVYWLLDEKESSHRYFIREPLIN